MDATAPSSRRPALWAAGALAAGILAAHAWAPPLWGWLLAAGLAGPAALWLGRRPQPHAATAALLLLLAASGGLRYHQDTRLLPPEHVRWYGPELPAAGAAGLLAGRLVGDPEMRVAGGRVRHVVELNAEAWRPASGRARRLTGRVRVTLRGLAPGARLAADAGDRVWLRCRLQRPDRARNPGAFDYRRYLALRGVHAVASVHGAAGVARVQPLPAAWWRQRLVRPARAAARAAVRANLSGAPAGLLLGMLLGDQQAIPDAVRADFRRTGLAHALVISGLHVGLVAAFVLCGLRLLRLPPAAAHGATTAALILYALVTGLQPPVVRAVTMATVILLGRAGGRRGEVCNSLGLAALVLLAASPASLLTLSFQLSFGATLAIVGLHGTLLRLGPPGWRDPETWRGRWLAAPLCVSLAAQLGTGPLIAEHFGELSPLAPAANLVVVPLLAAAVGLGLLAVLLGPWWPAAGTLANGANYPVLAALLGGTDWLAGWRWAAVPVPSPGVAGLALAALAALLIARAPGQRRARVGLLLLGLTAANLAVWSQALRPVRLEVVFLDVGQGDAAVLHLPRGRTMVVDGGLRSPSIDFGERVLVPYLRHRGVERVDVVVASHPHADHVGGLVHLLERVEVGHWLDAGQAYGSGTAARLRALIEARGISYRRVAAGDSLAGLDGVGGLVLHPGTAFVDPTGGSPQGLNNGSVVLRLDYGGIRLLFTGDVEHETDGALRAWGPRLRAEVLKVAHHGSRTSTTPAFLAAVAPRRAVVSVGRGNRFRHPAPAVLARLAAAGAPAWRTDRCGAVVLAWAAGQAPRARVLAPATCAVPSGL